MFGLRRHHRECDYPEQLAEWQVRHGADRHDMTPSQVERFREHNRLLNAGLDVNRVAFVRALVERGRINEDAVEHARRAAWGEMEGAGGY